MSNTAVPTSVVTATTAIIVIAVIHARHRAIDRPATDITTDPLMANLTFAVLLIELGSGYRGQQNTSRFAHQVRQRLFSHHLNPPQDQRGHRYVAPKVQAEARTTVDSVDRVGIASRLAVSVVDSDLAEQILETYCAGTEAAPQSSFLA